MSEIIKEENIVPNVDTRRPVIMPGQDIKKTSGKAVILPKPYRHRAVTDEARVSGFAGSVALYLFASVGIFLLNIITLGLIYPILYTWKRKYIIDNTYIGGRSLAFYGEAKDIYSKLLTSNYLSILTLGLLGAKKRMLVENWATENTEYMDTADQEYIGKSKFTGDEKEYFALKAKGVLATIFTLGFMYPVFKFRAYKYLIDHTYINGSKLELQTTTGNFYRLAVLLSLVTAFTVIGVLTVSIANKKYLYKYIVDTKVPYDANEMLDAGIGYDDAVAFSSPLMDIDEYTAKTAEVNGKSIDEVKPIVDSRVNWARSNASKYADNEKIYKKDKHKFRKIGATPICIGLIILVAISILFLPSYVTYQNMRNSEGLKFNDSDYHYTNLAKYIEAKSDTRAYLLPDMDLLKDDNMGLTLSLGNGKGIKEIDVPEKFLMREVNGINMDMVGNGDFDEETMNVELTSIKMHDKILQAAISGYKNLSNIEFSKNLETLGLGDAKLEKLTTPDKLISLKLDRMHDLTELELNEGLLELNINGAEDLTTLKVPDSVLILDISDAPNLKTIELGANVKKVFIGSSGVEKLILDDNARQLRLVGCQKLTDIKLNSNIDSVDIDDCRHIHNIDASATDKFYAKDGFLYEQGIDNHIYQYVNNSIIDTIDPNTEDYELAVAKLVLEQKLFSRGNTKIMGDKVYFGSAYENYIEVTNGEIIACTIPGENIEYKKGDAPLSKAQQKVVMDLYQSSHDDNITRLAMLISSYENNEIAYIEPISEIRLSENVLTFSNSYKNYEFTRILSEDLPA